MNETFVVVEVNCTSHGTLSLACITECIIAVKRFY